MPDELKPIRRSTQLAPLSREHHEGLLFAWKIKQGLENKTPLETLRNYTMWYWRHHIKPHFFQEEKILLPCMPSDQPMSKRLKEEHDHIRELVLGLDDQADRRSLVMLCDLINQHIRFEERELFVYLENHLTPQKLDEIFVQLEKHPLSCDVWKDEFWTRKKTKDG
jgi:hemerythrin-like domain-containing protein